MCVADMAGLPSREFDQAREFDQSSSSTWAQRHAVAAVHLYQRLVDGRPSPCRFTPSCSAYAIEALEQHGTGRGLWLTVRRLVRCRPLGPSGWDPVPESRHAEPVNTAHTDRTSTGRKGE